MANITLGGAWLLLLFGCLALLWLYALVNCLRRKDFSRREKVAWTIVILFTKYLGLIAYFIFCNRQTTRPGGRFRKALDPVTGWPEGFDPSKHPRRAIK